MENNWPDLSYEKGKDTYATLHMWTQIVGKIKLAVVPWINHSWHITLHITPTGLSTLEMPYKNKSFQIDFDFINHKLKVITSDGELGGFDLYGNSVADFYRKILYPEAAGYKNTDVKPKGAYYHEVLREFVLPYNLVQKSNKPEEMLLEFLNSTYETGATSAKWDRYLLET
ncbi:hypothetical protein MASR1M74_05250 [Lentimicrobium sp.]